MVEELPRRFWDFEFKKGTNFILGMPKRSIWMVMCLCNIIIIRGFFGSWAVCLTKGEKRLGILEKNSRLLVIESYIFRLDAQIFFENVLECQIDYG